MWAACLLACLVLPHAISASILSRQYYPQMDVIIEPDQYANQYKQQAIRPVQNVVPQYRQQSSEETNQQYSQLTSQQLNQKYGQQVNEQFKQQENKKYSQKGSQKYNQKKQSEKKIHQNWQPFEWMTEQKMVSSEHESQEYVKPSQQNYYLTPVNKEITFAAVPKSYNQMPYVSGDIITWKGIKMASGPQSPLTDRQDIETIFSDALETINKPADKTEFHNQMEAAIQANDEDYNLNASQLLTKYQYKVETHKVQTDDGYVLTLLRIPGSKNSVQSENRPVVFLMHGLLGSADDWLLMGPGKSLAYLLADADYDVWIGNARGNKYSRQHVSKHPAQEDFWQFSIDEIALHDLPTMMDYTLKTTGQEKMFYVGYSLGATAYFALASTRPEYNEKVITMFALAPMVYMSHVRSPMMKMIAPSGRYHEYLLQALGNGEFRPNAEVVSTAGGQMLENVIGCKNISKHVSIVMSGINVNNVDPKVIAALLVKQPSGESVRVVKHFAQAMASYDFRKYDFGGKTNKFVYGSVQPPRYDLTIVKTPVVVFSSQKDWLASSEDTARLFRELPQSNSGPELPAQFTHLDFQISSLAPQAVYQPIIETIKLTKH